MVAQVKPSSYTLVRHIPGTVTGFTVTVMQGRSKASVYLADPIASQCTCGLHDGGWCSHLSDAWETLQMHRCPLCGVYSALSVFCNSCVTVTTPRVEEVA